MARLLQDIPQSIAERLSENVRARVGDARFFGDIYLLDGWGGGDYNNHVFLNSYLFGVPENRSLEIEERVLRPVVAPVQDKNAANSQAAITLLLDESDTKDWMEFGPEVW